MKEQARLAIERAKTILGIQHKEFDDPVDVEFNGKMRQLLIDYRHLGPADLNNQEPFWKEIAAYWNTSADQARLRLCSNCEYADLSIEAKEAMTAIPLDALDKGDVRVWCNRFLFACHAQRTCDVWDEIEPDEKGKS